MSFSMRRSRKLEGTSWDQSIDLGPSPPETATVPPNLAPVIDLTGESDDSDNNDDGLPPPMSGKPHISKASTPPLKLARSPHVPRQSDLGSTASSKRKRQPQPTVIEGSKTDAPRSITAGTQHSPFGTPKADTEVECVEEVAASLSTPSRLPLRQTRSDKDSVTKGSSTKIDTPLKRATERVITPSITHQSQSPDSSGDEDREAMDLPSICKDNSRPLSRRSTSPQDNTLQKTPLASSSPVFRRGRRNVQHAMAGISGGSPPGDAEEVPQAIFKHVLDVPYLLELLQKCKDTMEDQIVFENKFFLEAAAEFTLTKQLAFVDEVSPFTSMRLDDIEPEDEIESLVTSINRSTNKHVKGTIKYAAKHVEASCAPRIPVYLNPVTTLHRNVLMLDDKKLRFVPQMPELEHTPEGRKKMEQFKKAQWELYEGHLETLFTSTRHTERLILLRNCLDIWLEELDVSLNETILQRCLLAMDLKTTHLGSTAKDPAWKTKTLIELWGDESRLARKLASLGGHLKDEDDKRAANFCVAFDRVFATPPTKYDTFDWSIRAVLFPKKTSEETTYTQISPKSSSAAKDGGVKSDRITTYAHLTCAICCTGMCQTHCDTISEDAPQSSNSREEGDNENNDQRIEVLNLPYEDMVRKHRAKMADRLEEEDEEALVEERPCSDDCFKLKRISGDEYMWALEQHSAFIKALPELLLSNTDKNNRSCHMALSWDAPCLLVHDEIQKYERTHREGQFRDQVVSGRAKKPAWYDNETRKLKGDWTEFTVTHLPEKRQQASPCIHSGPCTEGVCDCVRNKILCEQYCGCKEDCPLRFTGCSCSSSGTSMCCNSDTCICIQMNRECGPQCRSCGAIPRLKPANRFDDGLFSTGCHNVALQRGVSKKLVLGDSDIEGAGFGLYAAEEIRKNQYVSEYKGEVISSDESERRGVIYDEKIMSFLFTLNKEWVIDATRVGNKTRFINHAKTEQEGKNVAPKVMMVNGEYRIKFTALKDIPKATELMFDYGSDFEQKHKLGKSSAGKRGRRGRANLAAARGGMRDGGMRGGRGGNKAKKSAPTVQMPVGQSDDDIPILPPDDDDDDDDFQGPEEEEESEEEAGAESEEVERNRSRPERGRRAVRKPQRYTR